MLHMVPPSPLPCSHHLVCRAYNNQATTAGSLTMSEPSAMNALKSSSHMATTAGSSTVELMSHSTYESPYHSLNAKLAARVPATYLQGQDGATVRR